MTNGWVDIKNTDLMLIMGGNPRRTILADSKWALKRSALKRKMIVVGPSIHANGERGG